MAIADDWTLNYTAKTIEHTSGTTIYTVNALYSWLMDLFDDAAQMDDEVPMSAANATEYSFINAWTFGAPTTDINFLSGGAITDTADDTVWARVYTIGSDAVIASITLYAVQNGAKIWDADAAGHIDRLILVKNAGVEIDGAKVTIFAREYGYTYDHYELDFTTNIVQPAPISVEADLNNQTAIGTVAAYTIAVAFSSYTADVTADGSNENYEAQVDLQSTYTVANAYEWLKWLTRRGSTTSTDGVQGQLYTRADAAYTEVKKAPFGTFAGSKFFGARGVYFLLANRPASQANLYELIDTDGNTGIAEPTYISVGVTSIGTSDNVFVALDDGAGDVDFDQYTTAASGNSTASATVTMTASIATDSPASGVVRINGKRYTYSSYTGAIFTLNATDWPTGLEEDNNSVNAYVPWIDEVPAATSVSKSVTYVSDKAVIIRVRLKGIIPFQTTGSITSNGLSVAAIRTTDNVVT